MESSLTRKECLSIIRDLDKGCAAVLGDQEFIIASIKTSLYEVVGRMAENSRFLNSKELQRFLKQFISGNLNVTCL